METNEHNKERQVRQTEKNGKMERTHRQNKASFIH